MGTSRHFKRCRWVQATSCWRRGPLQRAQTASHASGRQADSAHQRGSGTAGRRRCRPSQSCSGRPPDAGCPVSRPVQPHAGPRDEGRSGKPAHCRHVREISHGRRHAEIVIRRPVQNISTKPSRDDAPGAHHRHPVDDVLEHGNVVGDEQEAHAQFTLQLTQLVQPKPAEPEPNK